MKEGDYYYTKSGGSWSIFRRGKTSDIGVIQDENIHETKTSPEAAKKRVYELNGWYYKQTASDIENIHKEEVMNRFTLEEIDVATSAALNYRMSCDYYKTVWKLGAVLLDELDQLGYKIVKK